MPQGELPIGFRKALELPLVEALLGRRSRRVFLGAEIPDGVFRWRSKGGPVPLSELETLLVVAACTGDTSWHHLIYRADRYAPALSNYAAAARGRTFPSAAGFHTSRTFFTDDRGVFLVEPPRDRGPARDPRGRLSIDEVVAELRRSVRKIDDGRLELPAEVPQVEPHNTWVANKPGTLLVMPVADLAQHVLLALCYMVQNGVALHDDVHGRSIPGLDAYADMFDSGRVWPITFLEQWSLAEVTAELVASCYAGALMLQAMGLGGWTFNGIDPFSLLGASGDPRARALGFRYDANDAWPYPNPTGRAGVMEAHCPPHYRDMRAAVEAVTERKFGPGGPYHAETPGPFRDTRAVRSAARPHDERFKGCVALQAQYVLDAFGKFPGTVPSLFTMQHLQAFHLDLEFYDRYYEPGAYLETHARHMEWWHGAR